jgi:outer membrane receptor for ferrienterochelin and colicins
LQYFLYEMKLYTLVFFLSISRLLGAQTLSGSVTDASNGNPLPWSLIRVSNSTLGSYALADGSFTLSLPEDTKQHTLIVTHIGYKPDTITISAGQLFYAIELEPGQELNAVVITGTMKPVTRSESPVAIDVITPELFAKSSAVCLFDAAGMINGVQPQMSCNVCNAGELRINGMDGPYTLVLIDGMPIVSSLSSVYGLNGIPVSLIERIEIMKGPASSLYGSEAMGGIINIITRDPECAPKFSIDLSGTSWQEFSGDAGASFKLKNTHALLGVNAFNFTQKHDINNDNFIDVTLQQRISVFNKYTFSLPDSRKASLAGRVVFEDRNGGELEFDKSLRGSNSIYGESIFTRRGELLGMWQLPLREKITLQFSSTVHQQDSWYGITRYTAKQQVNFAQLFWEKAIGKHSLLGGAAFRHTFYDDNTPATADVSGNQNQPMRQPLPGVFLQNEWTPNTKHKLLVGWRTDYEQNHGFINSPRIAWRWQPKTYTTLRAAAGTGFRVVNLFAEDHAALSGARNVIITETLQPESSVNGGINIYQKLFRENFSLVLDASAFYTHFSNKIIADYDSDPNEIRYANLNGFSVSRGAAINAELEFTFPLSVMAGVTYLDVFMQNERMVKTQQLHAPRWSGTFTASYTLPQNWKIDLNGRWFGPMRLPILPNDFRPEYSPWFCLLNVQVRKEFKKNIEVYAGIRNLLNFVPQHPIMRPFDPFDQTANDPVNNPNGYTFDPSYTYAPVQGVRMFAGVKWKIITD